MSRLDSFIRRLVAQRDIIDHICVEVAIIDGHVIELGLGNGRTYDHLRERLPGRRIVAFDRELNAHRRSTPEADDLVIGEIQETAQAFVGKDAALVHADIGAGYADLDAVTVQWLPDLAVRLLRHGGLLLSGLELTHPELRPLALPASIPEGRYFLYRRVEPVLQA